MVLIPMVRDAVSIPLIAAGGIASGRSMLAAEILGAEGSQVGSRFAASEESSAHENFKTKITETDEGQTMLAMKQLIPVRLLKNKFFEKITEAELRGASKNELIEILGSRRAKRGIFEGDLEEGELEIGQVAAVVKKIQAAKVIVDEIWDEYWQARASMCSEIQRKMTMAS